MFRSRQEAPVAGRRAELVCLTLPALVKARAPTRAAKTSDSPVDSLVGKSSTSSQSIVDFVLIFLCVFDSPSLRIEREMV